MRKLPPLIQLKAFEAAARYLSFKKAAEELNVAPTAISHHIKLLEEYCDSSLFRRRPRPIALTRAGESLFPIVRKALDEISRGLEVLRTNQMPKNLTLTTTSSFATKWLTPRLSDWRKVYPSLSLEVIATDTIVDLQVEADFSVRYMNATPYSPELITQELVRDNFIAVCNPELLTENKEFQTLAELSKCTLIHTHCWPDDITAPTWENWAKWASSYYDEPVDLRNSHHLTFHEEMQAIDAVLNGAGILIVSDFIISKELKNGALVKALDYTLPGYGFFLTYRRDHPHKKIFESFESWAREIISNPDGNFGDKQ